VRRAHLDVVNDEQAAPLGLETLAGGGDHRRALQQQIGAATQRGARDGLETAHAPTLPP
jgi:hypothetical protein